jgi:16S rRNA (guanine527-N7)-methyltransferase
MEKILTYFPDLNPRQREQFEQLLPLYREWNQKINVVSRKDIDNIFLHHILHSLAIAKVISFADGSKILDVGTGGGFPGIPLAILFPRVRFHLVDSIAKKIKVVQAVTESLNLENVSSEACRAEQVKGKFDFVVSRAVTALPAFVPWVRGKLSASSKHTIPNGILYLKGGELTEELAPFTGHYSQFCISDFFKEEYFLEKYVIHLFGIADLR